MERIDFDCKVITPLFCFGENQTQPELRASSLKGLFRYTYRIICQNAYDGGEPKEDSEQLFKNESEKFGAATDGNPQPSPLRLLLILDEPILKDTGYLVKHNKKDDNGKVKALRKSCIVPGYTFKIRVCLTDPSQKDWYEKLIKLSLLLGGIGKRSRRGRGCISFNGSGGTGMKDAKETKNYIEQLLNELSGDKGMYKLTGDETQIEVKPETKNKDIKRPVIEKILFGKPLKDANKSPEKLSEYLEQLDGACHEIKKGKKYFNGYNATGYANGGKRFASSLIVSLAETTDGLLPIYTHVKPVLSSGYFPDHRKSKWEEEWKNFLEEIEPGRFKN